MSNKGKKIISTVGKVADNVILNGAVTNSKASVVDADGTHHPRGKMDWARFLGQLFDWKLLLLIALLTGLIDIKDVKEIFLLFLGN